MAEIVIVAPALSARTGLRTILHEVEDLVIAAEAPRLGDLPRPLPAADVYLIQPSNDEVLAWPEELIQTDSPPGLLLLADDPAMAAELNGLPLRAWGLLPTTCSEEELLTALYAVELGLTVYPGRMGSHFERGSTRINTGGYLPVSLTDRELEVLALLADGFANKQISQALGISEHTVKFHVSSIYNKLDVSNRAEAVRIGIQLGLIVL